MADPQYSDLPAGAQVVSVPQSAPQTQPQAQPEQQYSDLPAGAQVVSAPQAQQPSIADQSAQDQARIEASDEYKRKTWSDIHNHVLNGEFGQAAKSFGSFFTNPNEDTGLNPTEVGKGAAKSAGQTVNSISEVMSKLMPSVVRPQDVEALKSMEQPKGASQQTGAFLETLAEFMSGNELVKGAEAGVAGMSRVEKLRKLLPMMKTLEENPKLLRMVKGAYNVANMSGQTAAISALHPEEGQARSEAAKQGAIGGALFGAGGEALSAGGEALSSMSDFIANKLRPATETVAGTEVPVKNKSLAARGAQALVPDTMSQFSKDVTGPAVAEGIGKTAQNAVGTTGDIARTGADPLGIRGEANKLKDASKDVFQKLDQKSGQMLSEAQQLAEDSRLDFSAEGRAKNREAKQLVNDIFDQYKNDPDMSGDDIETARSNWRKQLALEDINTKLTNAATEASESGKQDFQFKQGKQLSEAVHDLATSNKELLQDAGFTEDHIEDLRKFGRIISREAGDGGNRFTKYMGAMARSIGTGLLGLHELGPIGGLAGAALEPMVEHMGSMIADKMLGKVLTEPAALKTLSSGFSKGVPAAQVAEQLKQQIASTDPSWAQRVGQFVSDAWHDQSGELRVPPQFVKPTEEAAPKLSYTQDSSGALGNMDHQVLSTDSRGNKVGELMAQNTSPGIITVRSNQIYNEANRGKGYGKAQLQHLFDQAINNGAKTVKSDMSTTPDAQNVWKSMERQYPDAVMHKTYKDGRTQWSADTDALKQLMGLSDKAKAE
jgi:hypothetical protein